MNDQTTTDIDNPAQARATPFRLIVPTFTPFDEEGELDVGKIPDYARYLNSSGILDVFVNGTSGESASLTVDEAKHSIEAWCAIADKDLRVIAHVGHASVREAMSLARHAQHCGADAIAAAPPYYFKPHSNEALVEVMASIAGAAPNLPFYYYHIPSMTGVALPMANFLALATTRIASFAGLKFTYEDLSDYRLCLETAPAGCDIYFGRDEMLLAALATGAKGAVGTTYNVMPELYRELVAAFAKGDLKRARQLQSRACEVIEIAKDFGAIPAFKAMMTLKGMDCGPCRPPLQRLDPAAFAALRSRLESSAFKNVQETELISV